MIKDSVIIVRESDELVASCCVPFDGEFIQEVGKIDLFLTTSEVIKSTGELYKKLETEYGKTINMDVVDPRNPMYLFPRLIKDIMKYKVSPWQAFKTIFALKSPAVVCNGKLVVNGNDQISDRTFDQIKAGFQFI